MDIIPKKYDVLVGRIAAALYLLGLTTFGIYGSHFAFFEGRTKQAIPVTFEGNQALFMLWGTVIIFASIAGLAFPNRRHALGWIIACLLGSGSLFLLAYFLKL